MSSRAGGRARDMRAREVALRNNPATNLIGQLKSEGANQEQSTNSSSIRLYSSFLIRNCAIRAVTTARVLIPTSIVKIAMIRPAAVIG